MESSGASREIEKLEERCKRAAALPPKSSPLGGGWAEWLALLECAVRPALVVDGREIIRSHTGGVSELLDIHEDCTGADLSVISFRLGCRLELDVRAVIESNSTSERTVRGPDGRWLRLILNPCALDDGPGVVIALHDATPVHDLSTYVAWGSAIAENANEAFIGVYRDGTVVFWNSSASRLFGYTAREVDGQCFTILVPTERVEEIGVLARAVAKGLTIGPTNTVLIGKDGRRINVVWKLVPIVDGAGEVRGSLALCRETVTDDRSADVSPPSLDEHVLENAAALSRSNASLQREIMDRDRMAARVAQAQDLERRRIGRDLHDGVGQYLAALAMNLSRLESGSAGMRNDQLKLVSDATGILQRCVQEVRTVSHLLHPPMLDELGLVTAIRWFCEGFARRSGIKVGIDLDERIGRMASNIELALFRVLQESLTNIQRHSGSRTAKVGLKQSASMVHLEISDSGRGIAREVLAEMRSRSGSAGVGIAGMRDRLRQVGGRLVVSSAGSGVTVLAVAALEQANWRNDREDDEVTR